MTKIMSINIIFPDGISFDASAGTISVTSAAVPCVFTVRATGESSDGKILSRSVKVTVHGLSFDFGSGADESVTEGYTDINPLTTLYRITRLWNRGKCKSRRHTKY